MGRPRSFWSLGGGVPPRIDGQGKYILYLYGAIMGLVRKDINDRC